MMKNILSFLMILMVVISSCNTKTEENKLKDKGTEPKETKVTYPYKFVGSKRENAGNNKNKMDLFAYSEDLNLDTLIMFCKDKKAVFNSGTFYYIVIFDNEDNAVFPKDPFTAQYGMEEEPQKHIRAFYTYNKLNGYSELSYYEKNRFVSFAKRVNI